jgi:transposase
VKAAAPAIPQIDLAAIPDALRASVAALLDLVHLLISENTQLRDRIDLLVRRYFGNSKNEQIHPDQLQLLLKGFTDELLKSEQNTGPSPLEEMIKPAPAKRSKKLRRGVPDNVPVRHTTVLIPEEVKASPDAYREIDRTTTRVLDYEPGRFVCDEFVRPRFVLKTSAVLDVTPMAGTAAASGTPSNIQGKATVASLRTEPQVFAAAMPNRLIEKGLPGNGLLLHLILSRFEYHIPYYRLQKSFEYRGEVRIGRQTMTGWIEALSEWFEPLIGLIKSDLLQEGYLQVDETVIRYLDREERGKSKTGYFWVYARPGGDVLFDWQTGRSGKRPMEFLRGYKGRLQCDGYGVYPKLGRDLELAGIYFCVSHFRRKVYEAKEEDRRAAWYLLALRHLYAIEERLRAKKAGPALREAFRASEARPIWERMHKLLKVHERRVLPSSRMGLAIRYALERWEGLTRYLSDGRVEIDNNFVENAIRPTAIGKKNFLFIGDPEAGDRSATFYSLLACCKSRRINPELYLKDLLESLPDMKYKDLKDYTPKEWIKRHPEARVLPMK